LFVWSVEVIMEEWTEEFVRRVENVAVERTSSVPVRTEEWTEEFVRRVEKVAVE
jgi:hypothetical protein